jgi:molybdenum cofactor cytidylyltransferase
MSQASVQPASGQEKGNVKAQTVDVRESTGRILCCTIFRPGGRKLLAKGHVLSEEDVHLLQNEGLGQVWVTELEDGEIGEDQAVSEAAKEMGCGSLEIRLAAGGRANLFATEASSILVDDELLKQINCTASIVIATVPNFSYAQAEQRIATVKSAPFAVAQSQLEAVANILRERGPILQARPIRTPSVGVLYTDPVHGDRARQLFESIMRQRLERLGTAPSFVLSCVEEEEPVARSLQHLLRAKPTVILVASTTAPAGPEDVVGRAMTRVGGMLERFLAPVEPGNLFMLSYKDETPIVSAPGCFRSAKANIVDLVLPPMLARYRVSGWEVAGLGHGGLLG